MTFKKAFLASIVVFLIILCFPFLIHNELIDLINFSIPETVSYARVPQGTNTYRNIKIYDAKNGQPRPYKLQEFTGADGNQKYVVIHHKGQWVFKTDYISMKKFKNTVH